MGVKHFYIWFQRNYSNCIDKDIDKFREKHINNLCIDMNGIIHTCAQKIYEYGNNKRQRFITKKSKNTLTKQIKLFSEICNSIEQLRKIILPSKRIILCIDGVAGVSKLAQQRQRRFKSAREAEDNIDKDAFNPNCITAGTKFMDFLSKYIDWYCRMMISHNPDWKDLEIIFSNEKVIGEGEHKIINFIRKYSSESESFCIHGLDADLIMLSMSLENNNVFILRENMFPNETHLINIFKFKEQIKERLKWNTDDNEETKSFRSPQSVTDFVFMCFLVGNDFLPNIPCLAILEGGIDNMIDIYKGVCKVYGHLTRRSKNIGNMLNLESLEIYLSTLATYEKGLLEEKMSKKESFIEDPILNKYISYVDGQCCIDMENYKKEYYDKKLQGIDNIKQNSHEYLEGLNWVINYYKKGIPSWNWYYPNFYAPFLSDICKHVNTYKFIQFEDSKPLTNVEQMMCVLPRSSHDLLPKPFNKILYSEMREYYPEDFIIDCSGKRKEWEGIVLIKMVKVDIIQNFFNTHKKDMEYNDEKRNKVDYTYSYKYKIPYNKEVTFRSFYGDIINCCVYKNKIDL